MKVKKIANSKLEKFKNKTKKFSYHESKKECKQVKQKMKQYFHENSKEFKKFKEDLKKIMVKKLTEEINKFKNENLTFEQSTNKYEKLEKYIEYLKQPWSSNMSHQKKI